MLRQRLRVIYPVLVLVAGGLLAILSSISGSALRTSTEVPPLSRLAAATPTPIAPPSSVPGSTDGIMWMGLAITLIILIPIFISKNTWTRS